MADFLAAEQLKDLIALFKCKKEDQICDGDEKSLSSPYIIEPFSSIMKEEIIQYHIIIYIFYIRTIVIK